MTPVPALDLTTSLRGDFATLEIPKAPSAIRPNDCNNTTQDMPRIETPKLQHTASAVLNEKKNKLFRYMVFSKTTACSSYVQPWLVEIGGWRLAAGEDWRLAVGGSWQLVMGGWWRLAAVDGWRLEAVGSWWQLAVSGWWSLGAVLEGGP